MYSGPPGVERQPQREAHAVGARLEPGLVEQRGRALGVVSVELLVVDGRIVGPGQARIDDAASDLPRAQKHVLQEVVAIDRRQQGLAHLGLVERRLARVEDDEVDARIAHLLEREARVLRQDVVGAQREIVLVDVVDLAGLQRKQPG